MRVWWVPKEEGEWRVSAGERVNVCRRADGSVYECERNWECECECEPWCECECALLGSFAIRVIYSCTVRCTRCVLMLTCCNVYVCVCICVHIHMYMCVWLILTLIHSFLDLM